MSDSGIFRNFTSNMSVDVSMQLKYANYSYMNGILTSGNLQYPVLIKRWFYNTPFHIMGISIKLLGEDDNVETLCPDMTFVYGSAQPIKWVHRSYTKDDITLSNMLHIADFSDVRQAYRFGKLVGESQLEAGIPTFFRIDPFLRYLGIPRICTQGLCQTDMAHLEVKGGNYTIRYINAAKDLMEERTLTVKVTGIPTEQKDVAFRQPLYTLSYKPKHKIYFSATQIAHAYARRYLKKEASRDRERSDGYVHQRCTASWNYQP